MRIWDIPPQELCRNHLLGEHRELHGLWVTLTEGKKGYANHPEARRWRGKLKALYARHDKLAEEMAARGYRHSSPLAAALAVGDDQQNEYVDSYEEQIRILESKGCGCLV